MILDVKIEKKENIHKGYNPMDNFFFKIFLKDKTVSTCREVTSRKDGVGTLIYNAKNNSFIFIEQFRAGNFVCEKTKTSLEIPIGLTGKNEVLENVAIREVEEETGIKIKSSQKINSFFPEISSSSRKIHLFYTEINQDITVLESGEEKESEFTFIKEISLKETKQMLLNNKFNNSHTLIALNWFFLNKKDKK